MNSKYGYIYKITYTAKDSHLFNHFYIGEHRYYPKESLFDVNGSYYYHGSSTRADSEYWPYHSEHKKEIILWCNSREELRDAETKYIRENIENPLCINVSNFAGTNVLDYYDSDRRELHRLGALKRWSNPEEHEKMSIIQKERYRKHPEHAENISLRRKGVNQFKNETPEQHTKRIEKISKASKKVWENPEYKAKHVKRLKQQVENYYATLTPEEKQRHIEKMLETWKRNGTSFKGENNPAFGRRWMHNNIEQAYVKQDEINDYLEKGYVFGKLKRNKANQD